MMKWNLWKIRNGGETEKNREEEEREKFENNVERDGTNFPRVSSPHFPCNSKIPVQ